MAKGAVISAKRAFLYAPGASQQPQMPSVVDLHTHTYLCKHSETIHPLAYLELCRESGIRRAVCCHSPFPADNYDFRNRMRYSDLPLFFKYYDLTCYKAEEFRVERPLLSLEVDWNVFAPERTERLVQALLKMREFDYLIGSLHYNDLPERQFCLKLGWNEFLTRYCGELQQIIESRLFNVLAHADFLKNYHVPTLEFYRTSAENAAIVDDRIADAILRGLEANPDCVVEINTSARKKRSYLDYFPSKHIVRRLAAYKVKFGISSDSHWLVDVGQYFESCMRFLLEIGVEELHYFERFELRSYKISDALEHLQVRFHSTYELDALREEFAL